MEKQVIDNILEYDLIKEGENIVIGVSGGPDSMALLYLLIEAKKQIDFNINIAHVNHGVRGSDAKEDELFVEKKAKELNIPYYSREVDMLGYAKEKGISAEEAGRELRYGFFREILSDLGGGKIAVAHNMNDQAETLLMRILRGTGIDGLKGMDYIVDDIIRPILNISREDIETYIKENKIDTVLDKTNLMPIYTRNKIRLELIPYLENNFNPNIINALWRLSQTSSLDSNFLEKYAEERYSQLLKNEDKGGIVLDIYRFNKEEINIRQRIVRKSLEKIVGNLQGFGEQHISNVIDLVQSGNTGKEVHLPHNIVCRVNYDNLEIYKNFGESKKDFIFDLDLGYNELDSIGYDIGINVLDISQINLREKRENRRYFDFDMVKGKLFVRNRRNGDRFVPFGMEGRKKLKDYFIDEKISRDVRDNIPLIVDEENILWVIGYRTSDLYRVTKNTKNVLVIEYQHNN